MNPNLIYSEYFTWLGTEYKATCDPIYGTILWQRKQKKGFWKRLMLQPWDHYEWVTVYNGHTNPLDECIFIHKKSVEARKGLEKLNT